MKKLPILAAALVLCLTLALATAALGAREEVRVGNVFLADNGGISPSKLPRHGTAPVTARIHGEVGTLDGTHPPALEEAFFEVEKSIEIDAVGLPVCRAGQIQATSSTAAKEVCGDAVIGSGSAEVEVEFPEQTAFSATGPIVVFNGGVHGATTTVLLHAYVAVPAPTAVVVKAAVTRIHRGRYGLRISAAIPKIAGGAGSVTRFDLKIGRDYTYKGRRKSVLRAGCPTGTWATKGKVSFADGTRLGLTHFFPCTPS